MVASGETQVFHAGNFTNSLAPHGNELVTVQRTVLTAIEFSENEATAVSISEHNQMINWIITARVCLNMLIIDIKDRLLNPG